MKDVHKIIDTVLLILIKINDNVLERALFSGYTFTTPYGWVVFMSTDFLPFTDVYSSYNTTYMHYYYVSTLYHAYLFNVGECCMISLRSTDVYMQLSHNRNAVKMRSNCQASGYTSLML